MASHVLETKFWYVVVAIVAAGIIALVAVEVAGRPREMKLRVAGMHCEGCVSNVTEALKKIPGVQDAQVKFDPPASASAATDSAKPAAEEKKLGTATLTVAGLHTPSEKELQDAVHELAGENFEVTVE